jgi:hypothetical protein
MPETGCGLGAARDLELFQDVVNMVLDRADLDSETRCDLLVGETFVDQRDDAALPRCEPGMRPCRRHALRQGPQALDQSCCHPGRAVRLAAGNAEDGAHQLLRRRLSRHEGRGSGFGAAHGLPVFVEDGVGNDLRSRRKPRELLDDARFAGRCGFEKDHIDLLGTDAKQGVLVYGFGSHDRQSGLPGEQAGKPLTVEAHVGQDHHTSRWRGAGSIALIRTIPILTRLLARRVCPGEVVPGEIWSETRTASLRHRADHQLITRDTVAW